MTTEVFGAAPARVISPRALVARVGMSRTTIWREVKANRFPRPINLSPGRNGFLEQEVDHWLAERARNRAEAI